MNKKNDKGISGVVATVIMIAIVVVVIGIVWVFVNDLISDQIETSTSCYGNFGKVSLDKKYTCYNLSSNEFQFSINIADITIDRVLVSISSTSSSKSFKISDTQISSVRMYSGAYGDVIKIPGKNAGSTYVANVSEFGIGAPDSIKIAPIINDIQCDVSDSIFEIDTC